MTRFVRPHIARMAGYAPGEQPQTGGFIKLNTNENPYPPSPRVKAALVDAVNDRLRLYPDPYVTEFCKVAAHLHGVEPDMVIAGNGSDDLLTIITRTFVGPGDPAAFPSPSYLLYSTLIALQDGQPVIVPYTRDWTLEPSALAIPGLKLFYLANPDSPSGTAMTRESDRASWPGRSTVRWSSMKPTPISPTRAAMRCPWSRTHPNLIVTRSFSKGYSLAGIRLGYLVARAEMVEHLIKVKDSYNCDMLSQVAGIAGLLDQDYLAETRSKILATRGRLTGSACVRWATRSLTASPTSSGRRAARRPGRRSRRLKDRRILVRLMSYPGYPDGLRISVGTDAEIDRLLEMLEQID